MMYQVMVSTEGITILKTISVNFIIIIAIAKGAFTIIIIAVVIIEYKNCWGCTNLLFNFNQLKASVIVIIGVFRNLNFASFENS